MTVVLFKDYRIAKKGEMVYIFKSLMAITLAVLTFVVLSGCEQKVSKKMYEEVRQKNVILEKAIVKQRESISKLLDEADKQTVAFNKISDDIKVQKELYSRLQAEFNRIKEEYNKLIYSQSSQKTEVPIQ